MNANAAKMSLKSFGGVIPKDSKRKLFRLTFARIAANLLDIVGLAGVALLAVSVGSFATSGRANAPLKIPLIGEIIITEAAAVIVGLVIAATFVLKSVFSIFLNLRTSLFIATLESDFSTALAKDYFSGGSEGETGFSDSVSTFQNISMASTAGLSLFVNARISAISEITLLMSMVLVFLAVNPVATIAMSIYLAIVLWALSKVVTRKIRRNSQKQVEGFEAALTVSRDLFGVRREARAAGVLENWIAEYSKSRFKSASSAALLHTLNSLPRYVIETSLILGIFAFLSAIVVFSDLSSQAVTVGVFMAGGLRLVAALLPLQAAMHSMANGAAQGVLALERLKAIQVGAVEAQDTNNYLRNDQALSLNLNQVSFSFGQAGLAVEAVTFSVKAGQKVALVGPSGSGKTTCFELATGFRLPDSGEIKLGGVSPRVILEQGHGVIGIVPQRPHLISGTLAENISLTPTEQTDSAQAIACLKQAGLKNFSSLEMLQMKIQPDSGQLSGGEIQRLGLARALYKKPGILFLDEATSALDAETEAEINDILDGLRGHMTIVLIAHRLSTVKDADKIIYLDSGKTVAEGTFSELKKTVPNFEKAVRLMGLG
jgi:ATP-binding cassette subfamily C protein